MLTIFVGQQARAIALDLALKSKKNLTWVSHNKFMLIYKHIWRNLKAELNVIMVT